MEICVWRSGWAVRFYSFYHVMNDVKLLEKLISERQKTGVKREPLIETSSWTQCNTQNFVFAWVVSVTVMGLQVNLAKHK